MSSWKVRLLMMLTILAMLLAVSMGPAIANDGFSDDSFSQNIGASGDDHDDDGDDDDDDGDDDENGEDVDVDIDRALGLGPGNDCFLVTVEEDEDGDEELDVWLVCVVDGRWVFVERIA